GRRWQFQYVRLPRAGRSAGAGRTHRHMDHVHDVPSQGALAGAEVTRCPLQENCLVRIAQAPVERAELWQEMGDDDGGRGCLFAAVPPCGEWPGWYCSSADFTERNGGTRSSFL